MLCFRAMLFLLRPWILGLVVTVFATVGIRYAWRESDARLDAARARAQNQCRAYRNANPDANVCRDDAYAKPVIPGFKVAKKHLDGARSKIAAGDRDGAAVDIRAAFDFATDADHRGTFIGELVAATIVNEGLDVLEKHEKEFPPGTRAEIAIHARLESPRRPFETWRLNHLWFLSDRDSYASYGPIGAALTADAMLQDDAIFAEMDRAIVAKDLARCESAARGRRGLYSRGLQLAPMCKKAADIVRADARMQSFVQRAFDDLRL